MYLPAFDDDLTAFGYHQEKRLSSHWNADIQEKPATPLQHTLLLGLGCLSPDNSCSTGGLLSYRSLLGLPNCENVRNWIRPLPGRSQGLSPISTPRWSLMHLPSRSQLLWQGLVNVQCRSVHRSCAGRNLELRLARFLLSQERRAFLTWRIPSTLNCYKVSGRGFAQGIFFNPDSLCRICFNSCQFPLVVLGLEEDNSVLSSCCSGRSQILFLLGDAAGPANAGPREVIALCLVGPICGGWRPCWSWWEIFKGPWSGVPFVEPG